MPKRLLLTVALLIVAALTLAACGGGGDSDESKIEDAIETTGTTSDPAYCTDLETQNFLEQSSGETGKEALKTCEKEAEDESTQADSVEVSEVEVDGSKATANAALTGGSLDAHTVTIELVEEDGDWKLNELTGFVDFNRKALIGSLGSQLAKTGELSGEQSECIVGGIEEGSDEEIENLVLTGDTTVIVELYEACAS